MSQLVLLRTWNEGQFKLWWDQENHIVRSHCEGELDIEASHFLSEALTSIYNEIGPYRIFCDHRKVSHISLRGQQICIKLFHKMNFSRIAIMDDKSFITKISMTVFKTVGFKTFKHFDSENEAIKWLTS